MKLTVIGRYGPFPAPGGACSSYLLEADGTPVGRKSVKIVLDFGSGALSRLLQICDLSQIDAIVLSHLHSDHMSDMLVLRYALQTRRARGEDVPMPLCVVCPPAPDAEFRLLSSSGTFDMIAAHDNMKLRFGPLTITLHRMVHTVPSFAMDIEEELPAQRPVYGVEVIRKQLFYTGDTGMNNRLAPLCEKAAVLLADTGLLSADKTTDFAPHLTAKEAGQLARDAGVGQLLCSHIFAGYTDEQVLKEARMAFPNAQVVQEMQSYEI